MKKIIVYLVMAAVVTLSIGLVISAETPEDKETNKSIQKQLLPRETINIEVTRPSPNQVELSLLASLQDSFRRKGYKIGPTGGRTPDIQIKIGNILANVEEFKILGSGRETLFRLKSPIQFEEGRNPDSGFKLPHPSTVKDVQILSDTRGVPYSKGYISGIGAYYTVAVDIKNETAGDKYLNKMVRSETFSGSRWLGDVESQCRASLITKLEEDVLKFIEVYFRHGVE